MTIDFRMPAASTADTDQGEEAGQGAGLATSQPAPDLIEDLKAGRLVVVSREAFRELLHRWHDGHPFDEDSEEDDALDAKLAASPDHTTALLSLVEGMERERDEAGALLHSNGTPRFNEAMRRAEAAEARALAAEAKVEALREALAALAETTESLAGRIERDGGRLDLSGPAQDLALVDRLLPRARALTQEQNNG